MTKKNKDLGLCRLEELLPSTMAYMEYLWKLPIERQQKCIQNEDDRMAALLRKKLKDEYE